MAPVGGVLRFGEERGNVSDAAASIVGVVVDEVELVADADKRPAVAGEGDGAAADRIRA